MTLGLGRDRRVDGGVKQTVGFACSERRSKIGGILLAEAHIESAGAGHPYSVARLTEIMGERRDETESASGLAHLHVASGTTRAMQALLEGEVVLKPCPHQAERQILLGTVAAS